MHRVCDEPSCVRLADRRGMAARSRAIRAALLDGGDPDRLEAVLAAGDPWGGVLF